MSEEESRSAQEDVNKDEEKAASGTEVKSETKEKESKTEVKEEAKPAKQQKSEPTPAKKETEGGNRTCLTCFGLGCLGLVILAIIVAVGGYFLFRQALDVGSDFQASASEQGFEDFVDKTGIRINEVRYEDMCFTCDPLVYEGEVEKVIVISEDDASSWIQVVNVGVVALSDTQLNFSDDQIELKTNAGYAGSNYPVYMSGNIERLGNKEVAVQVDTVKVGGFSIPDEYVTYAEDLLDQIANDKLAEVDGLNIYKLEITEDGVVFEGTVPESISY